MADIIHIEEPLLRGILRVAPLKSTYSGIARNVTPNDMLQPLRDIIDICGTNPSSIEFSTNSQSSDKSGRDVNLGMKKDLLGRVRTIDMEFQLLKKEQYQPLHDFFMNLSADSGFSNVFSMYVPTKEGSSARQSFQSSNGINIYCKMVDSVSGWKGTISTYLPKQNGTYNLKLNSYYNPNSTVPTDSEITALTVTISGNNFNLSTVGNFKYTQIECDTGDAPTNANTNQYVIWYYVEIMLPENDMPIKEIVYVGDSGFTSLGTFYKVDTEIVKTDNDSFIEKKLTNIYVKNLKVPMIAKNATSKVRFDYVG